MLEEWERSVGRPKSQVCLRGLYNLYNIHHSLALEALNHDMNSTENLENLGNSILTNNSSQEVKLLDTQMPLPIKAKCFSKVFK